MDDFKNLNTWTLWKLEQAYRTISFMMGGTEEGARASKVYQVVSELLELKRSETASVRSERCARGTAFNNPSRPGLSRIHNRLFGGNT